MNQYSFRTKLLKAAVVLPFLFSLVGCGVGIGFNIPVNGFKKKKEIEYVKRDQVVVEEVASHPTQFVSNESVFTLWKRAELLSQNYLNTDAKPSVIQAPDDRGFHIRHFPSQCIQGRTTGVYAYEILAQAGSGRVSVKVDVLEMKNKSRSEKSVILAKNLARFLNTGTLERNLLNP